MKEVCLSTRKHSPKGELPINYNLKWIEGDRGWYQEYEWTV